MHWKYHKELDTVNNFGFVYLITNKKTTKAYIGCKQYYIKRGRKKKESGWETYMGSSKNLLEDIEKLGKDNFTFEIIDEYKNKRSLNYYECYHQMISHVLTATIEGTDEPAYYNNYVGGKFYRPVQKYVE